MPLQKGSSQSAFDKNFKQLLKDGYDKKQALAIAYDIQRKAKKKK
jgi:hypothetical protein